MTKLKISRKARNNAKNMGYSNSTRSKILFAFTDISIKPYDSLILQIS